MLRLCNKTHSHPLCACRNVQVDPTTPQLEEKEARMSYRLVGLPTIALTLQPRVFAAVRNMPVFRAPLMRG
jgi:hypothetical protein